MVKSCLILFNDSFPIGLAATNRIISMGKGLVISGFDVSLWVLRRTENPGRVNNSNRQGCFEGIKFEYMSASTVKDTRWIRKVYDYSMSHLRLFSYLLKNRNNFSIIIYPLDSMMKLLLVKLSLIGSKTKIVRHVDEYPPFVLKPHQYSIIYIWIYKRIFYKCFDGVITMTKALQRYYKIITPSHIPFLNLPMSVDMDRFISEVNYQENFITYCGNLGYNNKDGLSDLIKAFNEIKNEFPAIKLKIIGSSREVHEIDNLHRLVSVLKLEDRVIFTGLLPSYEIPDHLQSSRVLALARPANKQAEGGFPTKLGEYLSTGKPVVVTTVGEIPEYLTDGKNAFLARPDDFIHFSEKLREVLTNYKKALNVGASGREVAKKYFDYRAQMRSLTDFIETL